MRAYLTILLISISVPAAGQAYRCPGPDGVTVFQQIPCQDGEKIPMRAPPASPGGGIRNSERQLESQLEAERLRREAAKESERRRQEELAIERRKAAAAERAAAAEEAQARAMNRRIIVPYRR